MYINTTNLSNTEYDSLISLLGKCKIRVSPLDYHTIFITPARFYNPT